MLPLGYGHLEATARMSFEGYQPTNRALGKRKTPRPIGLGAFQETPYGAFFLYGFQDVVSGGSLIDATYAAEFEWGGLHFYPQLELERRSGRYVENLYGVNAVESAQSGLPVYKPGNSIAPNAAIAIEYPFMGNLKLTFQIRKRWLDKSIYESPLVDVNHQTLTFLAISRMFK